MFEQKIETSGEDTAFSQRSQFLLLTLQDILFSQVTSRNRSLSTSKSPILNINLNSYQYSTPTTPNRVDYALTILFVYVQSIFVFLL